MDVYNSGASPVRMTNTFRSTLQLGSHQRAYPENAMASARESYATAGPSPTRQPGHLYNASPARNLRAPVVRQFNQDSDIFGTKSPTNTTVQMSERYRSTAGGPADSPSRRNRQHEQRVSEMMSGRDETALAATGAGYGRNGEANPKRQMFEAYRASQNAGKGGAPKRTVRVYAAPMGAGQASYAGGAGVEDQQGKVADTTAMYKQSRLMQRSESISDGKKVHLTGSTTRQEKHWSMPLSLLLRQKF